VPSLRSILDAHSRLLILDAASQRVQVGLLGASGSASWQTSAEESGTGLFRCIEALAVDLDGIEAFAFCEGPGSVLGIRTAAMAIRVWCGLKPRPVFGYFSLALLAENDRGADATAIADARRGHWHAYRRGGPLRKLPADELAGRLITPEGFRRWAPPPAGVETVPYPVAELLARASEADLFRPSDPPDAFLHEDPLYAIWTPQVHRAP
jgi:tRNA threonylcarbamoyladenosine biosynthesis protein TsaB